MANALRGQFFWEKTTKHEDCTTGMVADIRRAQRPFIENPVKISKSKGVSISAIDVAKKRVESQKEISSAIRKVKDAILEFYGLTELEFEGEAGNKKLFPARCHYVWAVLKYNPEISKAGLGRQIGKHHSTIIHHERLFEQSKHMFPENVEAIERMIGYKPG